MGGPMVRTINRLVSVALCSLMIFGCSYARKEQLSKVESDALACRNTAELALANAREAKDLAAAADERTRQTEVVINRTYKKSMYK